MKIKGMLDIVVYNNRTQEQKIISGDNLLFNDTRHIMLQGWTNSYWSSNIGALNANFSYCRIYLSSSTSVPDRDNRGTIESSIYLQTDDIGKPTMTKIDDYTYDFLYTSGLMVPSSGSYTLRVVGLRVWTPYGWSNICTAMQIADPITHTIDVYVYVYYRVRISLDPDDYCYNILDCANITTQNLYTSSIGSYRKFWTLWQCGTAGSTSTVFQGMTSSVKGIYGSYPIAKGNPVSLAGLYVANNTSLALCTNGYRPSYSRVFAHLYQLDATPTYNNYLYYNTNSLDIPESYGTLTLDTDDVDHDDIYIPFAVKVNFTDDTGSGSVGDISYNLNYWYMQTGDTLSGSSASHLSISYPNNNTVTNWQMSTSCNRHYTCVHFLYDYASPYISHVRITNHKGVYRTWSITSWSYVPKEQSLCMMNDGTIFWVTGTSTLCRFSKIDNKDVTMTGTDIDTYNLNNDFSGITVYHMFSDVLEGSSGAEFNVVWILTSAGLIKMTEWTSATPEYEIYTTSTPNFGESLIASDFVPRQDNGMWSFQARNGAVGWITNSNQNKIVYWDSKAGVPATTYTESTAWSTVNIGDFAVSADGTYVAYTNRNASVQSKVRIRQPLSAWNVKYDYTFSSIQTVRISAELNSITLRCGNYNNYNTNNYSYIYYHEIDLINWSMKSHGYGYYASSAYIWKFADRCMYPGGFASQMWYISGSYNYWYSWSRQQSGGIHYGWNGSAWVHNHSGSRVTHSDSRYIPHNVSLAFNDASGTLRSFRVEDYYSFCIHPSGWIVDNLQALTIYDILYCWCTHLVEGEEHTIPIASPYKVTTDISSDLRFYSIDSSRYSQGFKVMLASDPSIVFTRKYWLTPTSTSTVTCGLGSKTWTIDYDNMDYNIGDTVTAYYSSSSSTYMTGTVTSYTGYTLTINVTTNTGGSNTFSSWYFTSQYQKMTTYSYKIENSEERNGRVTFHSSDAGKDVIMDYMWLGYEY